MDGFSRLFTFEELTDSKRHPELVEANRVDAAQYIENGRALSKLMEDIRHILGDEPIIINSGHRFILLNRAVGSKSDNSTHTKFKACDAVPTNMSIQKAFEKLISAKKAGLLPNLRKVLQEGTWLHIEVMMPGDDFRGFFVSHDGNNTWEKVA